MSTHHIRLYIKYQERYVCRTRMILVVFQFYHWSKKSEDAMKTIDIPHSFVNAHEVYVEQTSQLAGTNAQIVEVIGIAGSNSDYG